MDKGGKAGKFDWVPELMPGVRLQIAEHRRTMGAAHVAECWRRGVIEREPGWFFAAEGAVTVGVPWGDELMRTLAWNQVDRGQALVYIRPPEATHAA
ncbi:MAG: hypothetical protein KAY56_11205 [Inhella sp.]|nr:hypothetical protein [Inhella sp.]